MLLINVRQVLVEYDDLGPTSRFFDIHSLILLIWTKILRTSFFDQGSKLVDLCLLSMGMKQTLILVVNVQLR